MVNRFADNLKFLRKNGSISQSQLAFKMNKGQTTIANWENGKSEPSLDELIALSNYFDISPTVLLIGNLENVNLIDNFNDKTDFEKVNLIVNPSANLKGKNGGKQPQQIEPKNTASEPDENISWLLLQEVRRNSQNIDQLRVSIENLVKK